MLKKFNNNFLHYPITILLFSFLLSVISIYQFKNFELDASTDTLLIENDPDLIYLRDLNKNINPKNFYYNILQKIYLKKIQLKNYKILLIKLIILNG